MTDRSNVAEHEAVVDLLVLTAYADDQIDQLELDSLNSFDAAHTGWDENGFSVAQYLPVAIAKVRAILGDEAAITALLKESGAAITTSALKAETLSACSKLASVDGMAATETAFLERVRAALGS